MPRLALPSVGTYIETSATVYSQLLVAPTNRSSGLARDRLYYNNMGPGIKGYLDGRSNIAQVSLPTTTGQLAKAFEVVKSLTNNFLIGQLQKPFEIIKATLSRIDVAKLNSAAIVRGENNRFNPSIISKFKPPIGQVFVVRPTVTQLQKAFEVVKGSLLKIDVAKLNAMNVVRGDRTRILAYQVEKQKVPATNVGLFRLPLVTGQLSKAFEIVRADQSVIKVDKVSSVAVLKAEPSKLRTDKLNTVNVIRAIPSIIRISNIEKIKRPIEGPTFSLAPNILFPTPFQNTPNPGDFKFGVTAQTPRSITTSTTSLLQWYLEYGSQSDLLTTATSTTTNLTVKTFYFTPSAYTPYSVGSSIKVSNTNGSAYTATVLATDFRSVTIAMPAVEFPSGYTFGISRPESTTLSFGQATFTTPGATTWTCPPGVFSISLVAVGGGGGGGYGQVGIGGGGGALVWVNDIPVIPGRVYNLNVGAGGVIATNGGDSWFNNSNYIKAGGGGGGAGGSNNIALASSAGGIPVNNSGAPGGGGSGGFAHAGSTPGATYSGGGGGGAGGYSTLFTNRGGDGSYPTGGVGGNFGSASGPLPAGSGGGGGGASALWQNGRAGGAGGGVGLLGIGADGVGFTDNAGTGGTGGSGGGSGGSYLAPTGGLYGGGGGGGTTNSTGPGFTPGLGGAGAVRIIWSTGRSFPSTFTADLPTTTGTTTPATIGTDIGTFIESSATVYSQLLVAPTNRGSGLARDRLYYNNMSPGIQGYLAERSNVAQVSLSTSTGQLTKAFEIVKGSLLKIDVAKLNAAAIVRGDRTRILAYQVEKQKVPATGVGLFRLPLVTGQLSKAFEVVKDTRTTLVYSQLSKAFEIVRADQSVIKVDKLTTANVLRGIKTVSTSVSIVTQVKMPVTRYVFSIANSVTNQVAKLTSAAIVRDTQSKLTYSQLQKAFETIRSVNVNAIAGNIFKVKQPLSPPFVFSIAGTYTNQVAKLTAAAVVREARVRLTVDKLTTTNVLRGIKTVSTSVSIITQVKMPVTRYVFSMANTYTNQVAKLTAASVLREARSISTVTNRLESTINTTTFIYTQSTVAPAGSPKTSREALYYFYLAPDYRADHYQRLTNYPTVGVYNTPVQSGRVNAVNVLKGVTNNIQVARLKAINVLRDANTRIDIFGRLERRILLEANRITFLYTAASTSTTNISRLEQFDVGSYPGDFKLQIVGQNADYDNNLISWYLNDNDVLTPSVKSTSTTRTVYFNQALYTPFSVGTRIKLTSSGSNSILYYATVTSVTSNSVSFVKPSIDISIFNTYIEGGSSVYPRSFVSPTTAPKNARENLYFFELAPAIRDANKYQNTLVNRATAQAVSAYTVTNRLESTINTSTFIYAQSLVNPAYPTFPQSSREVLYYFYLAPSLRADYWQRLTNRITIGPEQQRLSQGLLSPLKVGKDSIQDFRLPPIQGNLSKAFEIVKDVFNTFKLPYAYVIRLKTGDGKNGQLGVQDPTFRKKAPIQFWN